MIAFVNISGVADWTIIVMAILFGTLLAMALGFVVGQYNERVEWNKLIHNGKIRRPGDTTVEQPPTKKMNCLVFTKTERGFYIRHKEFPSIWSRGRYKESALGRLITYNPDVFGISLEDSAPGEQPSQMFGRDEEN